jgi:hypothetical protein
MYDTENLITSAKRIRWNKGKLTGAETTPGAEACLGNPRSSRPTSYLIRQRR